MIGLVALADAFRQLAIVIAADWSAPPITVGVVGPSLVKACTPDDIIAAFVNCSHGAPQFGVIGHIRPEWQATPFLFGHWGF